MKTQRAAGGSLRGACPSASRHLSRNGNLVSNEEEEVKNTNRLNGGRELPAGGTWKWLGKVLPFESSRAGPQEWGWEGARKSRRKSSQ